MSDSKRVEFKTIDGVTLRGDFYQAEGENRACVVMTCGFTLVKEFGSNLARRFRDAGVSALIYDYRSYGSSDGLPRNETSIVQQAEDYKDALTAAMKLPGVDPMKVVLWGIGHGGAATAIAAASEPRAAAVILQSPIVSGSVDTNGYPKDWEARARWDREARAGGAEPSYSAAWPEKQEDSGNRDLDIANNNEMAFTLWDFTKKAADAAGTPWENKVTLQSYLNIAAVEPKDVFYRIKQPTLHIVAPADPFTGTADYHREAFCRFGKNAEFIVFEAPADSDFDGFLGVAIPHQVEFLNRVL